MSVRFLGRRVYLGLAVVLMSAGRSQSTSAVAQLNDTLNVPVRTIQRWRSWWAEQFPLTPLWQVACARFMPPVDLSQLPSQSDRTLYRCCGRIIDATPGVPFPFDGKVVRPP